MATSKHNGAAGFFAYLRTKVLVPAMGQVVDATVEYGRELVGTPVERDGEGTVIRSKPGYPPRKDTGELQANIKGVVSEGTGSVTGTVSSSRPSTPHVPASLDVAMERHYFGSTSETTGDGQLTIKKFMEVKAGVVIREALRDRI